MRPSENHRRAERGFTLIELLIAVVIIAILAAIAVPIFLSHREKTSDGAAQSAARQAATVAETYYVDDGTFAGMDAAALRGLEASLSDAPADGSNLTVAFSGSRYVVAVRQTQTGNTFAISKDQTGGAVTRSCGNGAVDSTTGIVAGTGDKGSCPTSKTW